MGDYGLKVSGGILLYRLYDVAWDINLQKVEERVRSYRRQSIDRKRFSKAFEFTNPPLSLNLKAFDKNINGKQYAVNAYAKAYDYGVLSIIFEIPFKEIETKDFEGLAKNGDEPFKEDFRKALDRLVDDLGDALHQANRSRFEEDYTVYYLTQLNPEKTARDFLRICDIGSLLLYEEGESPAGEAVKEELLSFRFSYSDNDLVILSWDKAFVLEPSGSMDIPDLLEFANTQLLELRVYDDMVDKELDIINDRIITEVSPSIWKIRRYEELAARVMRTVTDLTGITEKIDNSLKVTEDVYYARVYMAALSLFKVREWETSIERKINIASRVYDMLYREISNKRTELLEFIIVILIAIEIVLFLMVRL
ncbi:MAG TPA: hypothetical protein DCP92_16375 [Nitrospiraceae bacterium]|jgi:hypothetical protein|nr:hypothetical protein [Nitrospiraceae bacterium]